MNQHMEPSPGESAPGIEYASALAALEDRQIFAITPIEGGFEVREQGRNEYFVRLLPEQLRELGEEIIALSQSGDWRPASELPDPAAEPEAGEPVSPAVRGHTITIPPGIWNVRVTEEFQARIARLGEAASPAQADEAQAPGQALDQAVGRTRPRPAPPREHAEKSPSTHMSNAAFAQLIKQPPEPRDIDLGEGETGMLAWMPQPGGRELTCYIISDAFEPPVFSQPVSAEGLPDDVAQIRALHLQPIEEALAKKARAKIVGLR